MKKNKIKKILKAKGLKSSWVAAQMGMSYRTFFERMQKNNFSLQEARKFCEVTGSDINEL